MHRRTKGACRPRLVSLPAHAAIRAHPRHHHADRRMGTAGVMPAIPCQRASPRCTHPTVKRLLGSKSESVAMELACACNTQSNHVARAQTPQHGQASTCARNIQSSHFEQAHKRHSACKSADQFKCNKDHVLLVMDKSSVSTEDERISSQE